MGASVWVEPQVCLPPTFKLRRVIKGTPESLIAHVSRQQWYGGAPSAGLLELLLSRNGSARCYPVAAGDGIGWFARTRSCRS
jgi:hypothetical protein